MMYNLPSVENLSESVWPYEAAVLPLIVLIGILRMFVSGSSHIDRINRDTPNVL